MDASQKKECFKLISENILSQQWKKVGKNLGLEEPDLNAIYADCRIRGDGAQEIYLQMLLKWEHKFPERVNFQFLYKALKDSDRSDLAEKIVQVARGTKFNSSNASNTAFPKVSRNSQTPSNNQDIRPRSSVPPRNTYSSVPELNVPAEVIKDNSVVQEEIYTKELIPDSKAYYWQMVKNKMYLILIIAVIVLCIYMYYGKTSAMEFLHGLGEALMTYGSLPAIGYVFGKLLCIWFVQIIFIMDASQKKECFRLISENILSQQWKKLGKNLGLEEPDLNAIYADCRIRGDGSQEIYLQMLLKWEQKFPEYVNFPFLYKALKDSDRTDLAENIAQFARGTNSDV